MAELQASMPFSSNLITAEIRVENLAESTSTISIPQPSSSVISQQQQQQQNVEEPDNNNSPSMSKQQTEPEAKRIKLDTSVKNKKLEKLESRLGSVLCCAVCLDLPKTAMYQVSRFYFQTFPFNIVSSYYLKNPFLKNFFVDSCTNEPPHLLLVPNVFKIMAHVC